MTQSDFPLPLRVQSDESLWACRYLGSWKAFYLLFLSHHLGLHIQHKSHSFPEPASFLPVPLHKSFKVTESLCTPFWPLFPVCILLPPPKNILKMSMGSWNHPPSAPPSWITPLSYFFFVPPPFFFGSRENFISIINLFRLLSFIWILIRVVVLQGPFQFWHWVWPPKHHRVWFL